MIGDSFSNGTGIVPMTGAEGWRYLIRYLSDGSFALSIEIFDEVGMEYCERDRWNSPAASSCFHLQR